LGAELLHLREREIHHRIGSSPQRPAPRSIRPRPAGALPFTPPTSLCSRSRVGFGPLPVSEPRLLGRQKAPSLFWTCAVTERWSQRNMATTKPSASTRPPPDGLTRSQVAQQMGVGVTAVHHMRLRGELRPTRDAAGTWRYDPADVIRAAS